ncbi:tRNA lysidine(34) synthetase TilS [Sphingosinicellaceae bacterium]|nr:tRNA lysidine(34) synthetase TilS [Sphingosinicellaceae bacterium]
MQGVGDAVERLIGRPLRVDERVALAVSGGPDSLALLLLAHDAFGSRIVALTVDHALRAGSAGEAAMVAMMCTRLDVEHVTLCWTGIKPSANLQAEARQARYALMGDWCAAHGVAWLLTGHHADDQAETLLMRLARGSGSGGLAGIRAVRALGNGVTLLRPLLGERRTSLGAIVAAAGLTPVDDPANRDPRHDRTGARTTLAATPWLDPGRLAAAAAHLAEAEAALDWAAGLAWDSRVEAGSGNVVVDAAGLPDELLRRLVARAFASFGEAPDGPRLDRLIIRLAVGGAATLGSIKGRGGVKWTFSRVAPRVKP